MAYKKLQQNFMELYENALLQSQPWVKAIRYWGADDFF